jgi:hypothetical protein
LGKVWVAFGSIAKLNPVHADFSVDGLQLMKEAYAYAIENGYRFYSYADACKHSAAAAPVGIFLVPCRFCLSAFAKDWVHKKGNSGGI